MNLAVIEPGVYTHVPFTWDKFEKIRSLLVLYGCKTTGGINKWNFDQFQYMGWSGYTGRLIVMGNYEPKDIGFRYFVENSAFFEAARRLKLRSQPQPLPYGRIPEEVMYYFRYFPRAPHPRFTIKTNDHYYIELCKGYWYINTPEGEHKDPYSSQLVAMLFLLSEYKAGFQAVTEVVDQYAEQYNLNL